MTEQFTEILRTRQTETSETEPYFLRIGGQQTWENHRKHKTSLFWAWSKHCCRHMLPPGACASVLSPEIGCWGIPGCCRLLNLRQSRSLRTVPWQQRRFPWRLGRVLSLLLFASIRFLSLCVVQVLVSKIRPVGVTFYFQLLFVLRSVWQYVAMCQRFDSVWCFVGRRFHNIQVPCISKVPQRS